MKLKMIPKLPRILPRFFKELNINLDSEGTDPRKFRVYEVIIEAFFEKEQKQHVFAHICGLSVLEICFPHLAFRQDCLSVPTE
jgi:hypothetical protein